VNVFQTVKAGAIPQGLCQDKHGALNQPQAEPLRRGGVPGTNGQEIKRQIYQPGQARGLYLPAMQSKSQELCGGTMDASTLIDLVFFHRGSRVIKARNVSTQLHEGVSVCSRTLVLHHFPNEMRDTNGSTEHIPQGQELHSRMKRFLKSGRSGILVGDELLSKVHEEHTGARKSSLPLSLCEGFGRYAGLDDFHNVGDIPRPSMASKYKRHAFLVDEKRWILKKVEMDWQCCVAAITARDRGP
jgi:hypothetical protein